jgi:hypothetical protein
LHVTQRAPVPIGIALGDESPLRRYACPMREVPGQLVVIGG